MELGLELGELSRELAVDTDAANAINVDAAATAMGGVVVCLGEFSIARACGRHNRIMTTYRSMRVCVRMWYFALPRVRFCA